MKAMDVESTRKISDASSWNGADGVWSVGNELS